MKTLLALILAASLALGVGAAAAGAEDVPAASLTEQQRQTIAAQADIAAGELKALVQLYALYGVITPEEAGRMINGITGMTDRLKEEPLRLPQAG